MVLLGGYFFSDSTATDCRSRSGSIPGLVTLPNGTTVTDESGGFVVLEFLFRNQC